MPHDLALSRSAVDRDAVRRGEPDLLERLLADPATAVVLVDDRGRVAVQGEPGRTQGADLPLDGLAPLDTEWCTMPHQARTRLAPLAAGDLDARGLSALYLGREDDAGAPPAPHDRPGGGPPEDRSGDQARGGVPWVAVVLPSAVADDPQDAEGARHAHADIDALLERHPLAALRAVGAQMDAHDAGLATTAVALAAWHARSGYCPACGSRTEAVQAGWARHCPACGATHFPRTDPAVIMAVTDQDDRLLLVHGAAWEERRYSVVAGFVEAGESAEAAVVREVWEETGLRVAHVEQVATQPWPFPRSLMLGYRARLAPGQEPPRPDDVEVTRARLVTRAQLAQAVADGEIALPGRTSIARVLIEDWYGRPVA